MSEMRNGAHNLPATRRAPRAHRVPRLRPDEFGGRVRLAGTGTERAGPTGQAATKEGLAFGGGAIRGFHAVPRRVRTNAIGGEGRARPPESRRPHSGKGILDPHRVVDAHGM